MAKSCIVEVVVVVYDLSVEPLYRRHYQAVTVFLELSLTLKDSGLKLIEVSIISNMKYKDISSAG